ncbi:hypothetical protein XO08_07830 [Thermosipho sp. 1074]|nr:hypothetical protein XO08_07830 [Thermosipho sp. 1074]
MLITNQIGIRTFEWLKQQIELQINAYIQEFKEYLDRELVETFTLSSKIAHETIKLPFNGVPTNAMLWFNENFMNFEKTIMKNYAGDLMKTIENILTAGLITGTPPNIIAKSLMQQILPTNKRRITVMVRDQLGNALQQGIWKTYQEYNEVIDKYKWVGPKDKRTTDWCKNRKKLTNENPWTFEQIQRYIETNPKKLKGLEIRADHGTFLHPHIQCRHRLLAIPKSPEVVVSETIKSLKR